MDNYFKTFQNINHSIEQTLKAESNSIEIEQSATQLKQSVQPCLEELRQSTDKLNKLVQVCFSDLQRAEDVWNSKLRIVQAPTLEIIEQIGELTGRDVGITPLVNKYRTQVIAKANESWKGWIERLRQKWFVDAEMQLKKGVGRGKKDSFVKDIRAEVIKQLLKLDTIIQQGLSNFYKT